ncbi:ALBINO3-like protein 1, chloroplastic [Malania oleifera]|uniref:ALBINO3-like protein 1, chloroplastic n=1 Tax=Malania oleifera TaxID=397392 RepID=UPI0025AE7278|nr:ALBINO3-like protein 1, chloroplastic [Malania oleifera]
MATFLSYSPHLAFSPFPDLTRNPNSLLRRTHCPPGCFPNLTPSLRGGSAVARVGFKPGLFPDPDSAEAIARELLGRAESFLFTVADAAVSTSDGVTGATKQNSDWLSGISTSMENVLKVLKDGLSALHVPYAYGFAIILLTVIVKAATFPLTKKQVESAMAMRSLQPQIKAIQQRYAGDQERIQVETARLYKLAGINPLAGCFPTLFTIPVWIGLYRALSNVADEGLLTEGFFWIPSLSGPTTIAARQSGSSISWLFPFVDGHPPLGWSDTLAYLVLPLLLIASQYISVQLMQSSQSDDPNLKNSQALTKFLPLLIGYFALSVPSGLSLYWFTNNILSTAQQVWLQKLGGAKNPAKQFSDAIGKEEPSQIQKTLFETNSMKAVAKQGEKLTPEGPRPGERFKQIKEQEARIRRQREEEKRRAEEASADRIQITNEGHEKEPSLVERENGGVTKFDDGGNERFQSVNHESLSGEQLVVNGGLSSQESMEDQKKPFLKIKTDEISSAYRVDGRDGQHSQENLEQDKAVEIYTTLTGTDKKNSSGDEPKPRQEVHAEKED